MITKRRLAATLSAIVAPLPRIKGLGAVIAVIANCFADDEIVLERDVLGSRMRLRTNDLIGRFLIFTPNYFDRIERQHLERILAPGDTAVDLGANIGAYSLWFARKVGPSGKVVAIEAEAVNAGELRYNIALNRLANIEVVEFGISDKVETLDLMLNTTGNAGGHSFFDQSHIAEPEVRKIECRPLSDIWPEGAVKLLKLDIEGFEARVLRRFFEDRASADWPQYIMLEDNPDRREGDAVATCTGHGYVEMARVGMNVFLRKPH